MRPAVRASGVVLLKMLRGRRIVTRWKGGDREDAAENQKFYALFRGRGRPRVILIEAAERAARGRSRAKEIASRFSAFFW